MKPNSIHDHLNAQNYLHLTPRPLPLFSSWHLCKRLLRHNVCKAAKDALLPYIRVNVLTYVDPEEDDIGVNNLFSFHSNQSLRILFQIQLENGNLRGWRCLHLPASKSRRHRYITAHETDKSLSGENNIWWRYCPDKYGGVARR